MSLPTPKVVAHTIDPVHIRYICPFGCHNKIWIRKKAFHQHGSNHEAHNRIENRLCDNCPFYKGMLDIEINDETIRENFVIKHRKSGVLTFD